MVANPDRYLWLGVIDQAFFDATSSGKGKVNGGNGIATWAEKLEAHEWLLKDSRDKDFVCMMAGVAPREVTAAYLALLRSGEGYVRWKNGRLK